MTTLRVDRRSNRVDRIATTRSGRPGSSRRLDPRPAGGEYNAPWPPGRRGGRQGAGGSARPDPPAEGPAAPRADPDPSPGWEGAVAARRGGTRPPPGPAPIPTGDVPTLLHLLIRPLRARPRAPPRRPARTRRQKPSHVGDEARTSGFISAARPAGRTPTHRSAARIHKPSPGATARAVTLSVAPSGCHPMA